MVWWERVLITNRALDANPADRLAYRELRRLTAQKHALEAKLGSLGTAMLEATFERVEIP